MFSEDEVEAAVRRYLSTDVESTRLKTGARDVLSAKEQVYDLVATTLLLEPDSYFYVIWLASNKLTGLLEEQLAAMALIVAAAPASSRGAKLLGPPTELVNAEAAIIDLTAAFNTRTSGVGGTIGPAVERFRTAVDRYIKAELVKNVVVQGDVVETGEELRKKIQDTWATARQRHQDITALAGAIEQALVVFRGIKLPDSSVKKIVAKIQAKIQELQLVLSGSTAVRESRGALLDLLAMRTLLQRCSSFRTPLLVLAPLSRDDKTGVLVDSVGDQAFLLGTVSGPYNYDLGTVLQLSLNSAAETVSVGFPDSSRAQLRSAGILVFPTPAGTDVAVRVDEASTAAVTTAAWASGVVAAAALDATLSGVDVAWDPATSQLVFRSQNTGDVSALRFLGGTTPRDNFLLWAFGGGAPETRGIPLAAQRLVELLAAETPNAVGTVVAQDYGNFVGERTALGGEEAIIWNRLARGTDLVSDGTAVVTASLDLSTLGVIPGMGVVLTAPTPLTLRVVAIDGGTLTLDDVVPASGGNTYYIGPDYSSIPVGSRAAVTGVVRGNDGYFRVLSAAIAKIELDRDLAVPDNEISVSMFSEFLRVEARGTTTTSGIGAAATPGAAATGIVPSAEHKASLAVLRVSGSTDLLSRGVTSDDLVQLQAPGSTLYDVTVSGVAAKELTFSPSVLFEAGNWEYEVRSRDAAGFTTYQGALAGFIAGMEQAVAVEAAVSRLVRGARYSADIQTALLTYEGDLETLKVASSAYVVPRDQTVDQIVRTFQEEGYDRALDLFLALELKELFSMQDDGVSYSSWLVRKSADVARQVTPVSKDPRDVTSQWRTTATQSTSFDPRAEPEIK